MNKPGKFSVIALGSSRWNWKNDICRMEIVCSFLVVGAGEVGRYRGNLSCTA